MKHNKLLHWTIFVDMLGYRDINGQIDDDSKAEEFIQFMNSNIKMMSEQNSENLKKVYKESSFDLYEHYDIKTLFVSDSLIITYKPKKIKLIREEKYYMHSANTLFIIMSRLQEFIYKCLTEKNIFLRGGISNGYCNVNDNFAFGNGLIEAYEVESKIAVNPRICLADSIINNKILIEKFNLICEFIYGSESLINNDKGVHFIDYLQYSIYHSRTSLEHNLFFKNKFTVHRDSIILKIREIDEKIKKSKSEDERLKKNKIKDKFLWLKEYHNEKMKNVFDDLLID